ncbi:hypothetical protein C1H76_4692 [Elsinoe australis]|uniref:Phosphoribosylaminoimidazole-succinocarboxamide synthase n=1 Tax=Elsinoe australis TaxID=40998 RepID=A0A4U7B4U2_9PEZI|nr:hypothetical protein C1H76_4692 [Elsinoe australis]
MPSPSPVPFVGHTNVSQPQLHQASDTQSVTASEDYYSLTSSSAYSDESQSARPAPIRRYQTPPSRYRTPMASGERIQTADMIAEQTNVPMRGTGRRRQSDADRTSYPNPLQSNPRVGAVGRKPVPSTVYEGNSPETIRGPIPNLAMSSAAKDLNREPSPPTPGVDDTPYIHFALDQLTRDEEVRGSRMYPGKRTYQPSPVDTRPDSQNTARPSYVSMSPEGFDNRPGSRLGAVSPIDWTYDSGEGSRAGAVSPMRPEEEYNQLPVQASSAQAIPPKHPGRNGSYQAQSSQRSSPPEVFLAFDGPSGVPYMSLDYLPALLRPIGLVAFILALLLLLAALIFSAVWSITNDRLWEYSSFGDVRYFVFQYLPTILGVLILLWLFQIQAAIYRIAPFIALSSKSSKTRSHASLLPIYPSTFAVPNLAHFSAGLPAFGTFLFISWLSLFTVPLLATSFNVYQVNGVFSWLATQGAIWTVIGLYILLLVSSVWLLIFLRRRQTGLKWDPVSLADHLVLLEKSNVLDAYASYFCANSDYDFREDVAARGDRLGYWRTSTRPNAAIHTIGAPNQPARQYIVENGTLVEKTNPRYSNQTADLDCQRLSQQTAKSLIPHSAHNTTTSPYLPLILRPLTTLALASTLFLLLLAFLIISYLPQTAIQSGFAPTLPIPVNPLGFSPTNFLYSFVPSLLGLLLFLLLQTQDLHLRRLQPIANLRSPAGSLASSSLLTSYPSDPPFLVSLRALLAGNYRLALLSFATSLATALPVLAGGVFWAQFSVPQQSTLVYGHMPAFYALSAFFAIACLAPWTLPLTRRHAERYSVPTPEGARSGKKNQMNRLVDVVALVGRSMILTEVAFRAPGSRVQMVTRLLAGSQVVGRQEGAGASKVSLVDSIRGFGGARDEGREVAGQGQSAVGEGRYALGKCKGRDGREWVGVDRVERMVGEHHREERAVEEKV